MDQLQWAHCWLGTVYRFAFSECQRHGSSTMDRDGSWHRSPSANASELDVLGCTFRFVVSIRLHLLNALSCISAVLNASTLGWLLLYFYCLMGLIQDKQWYYGLGGVVFFGLTSLGILALCTLRSS